MCANDLNLDCCSYRFDFRDQGGGVKIYVDGKELISRDGSYVFWSEFNIIIRGIPHYQENTDQSCSSTGWAEFLIDRYDGLVSIWVSEVTATTLTKKGRDHYSKSFKNQSSETQISEKTYKEIFCGGLYKAGDKLIISKGSYTEKQWLDLLAQNKNEFDREINRQKMTLKCEVTQKLF